MTKKISGLIGKGRAALAGNKAAMREADQRATRSMVLMAVCAAAILPGVAMAAAAATPWDSMGTQVLAIFQSGLTRTIAIVSVIACGIAALAGKLSWDWAIKIIVGIVLIFGGTALVDFLIDATS
ncbi:TrbC/VirB2 family protein [[Empedobacter] haloabium]|uniref:TrbC/VirB2 family protein n=1 Tax=[Empedobacter] haloabium TaxID=592317 RepID=A0ABZ1UNY6_9BURK